MAEPIRWQDKWWHQQPDGTWLLFNEETQAWEPYSGPVGQTVVYVPSPGMSTGAKWVLGIAIALVVLFIVMTLAAIAIPVFLRQREKGWEDQVNSALRNAAVAQERYLIGSGDYTDSTSDLRGQGLKIPLDVDIVIVTASAGGYCLEATHDMIPGDVWSYDSSIGQPRPGPCL